METGGYDINHLVHEAQTRWLKPVEVYFILKNFMENQITHRIPQRPASGSLFLFNKRVTKSFRKDGHSWRKRRDQRTIAEAHERLKVGTVDALNCYYAHGEHNHKFQRRSYWILDPNFEHIVLVHYRDTEVGRQSASTSQVSPLSSPSVGPQPSSLATRQPDSYVISGSHELRANEQSPSSVEISSSDVDWNQGLNELDITGSKDEDYSSSGPELNYALQTIKHQLSLDDDETQKFTLYLGDEYSNDLEDVLKKFDSSPQISTDANNLLLQQFSDEGIGKHHPHPGDDADLWDHIIDGSQSLPSVESQAIGGHDFHNSSMAIPLEVESMDYLAHSPICDAYGTNSTLSSQDSLGINVQDYINLTIAPKQKFTIQEISPDWCYTSESAKIIIIGSFLCEPSECSWACMFGDIEVPIQIIRDGVVCCHAPPQLQAGKVNICITSGNRESCSEVREFVYRAEPIVCKHNNSPETEDGKSSDELLLIARFVQMLLSDQSPEGDVPETDFDLLAKYKTSEGMWSQVINALSFGTSSSASTLNWLLEELLKDKLGQWLSSRSQRKNQKGCSLPKKEQGIIHMAAGLGYEWALVPILNSGISANFRDSSGWTALHWAARFGREKVVATLMASGASPGAITDPTSQDPTGKTPASIAADCGYTGLAGYLSEMALTDHLSSLVMKETELSKGSAALESEKTIHSLSNTGPSFNEDQGALKDTLAAVRYATQAAALIQSAFRAHSFRKRQQNEAAVAISGAYGDEYSILESDIKGLSAASKLAFHNARDYSSAALSIQKKYRGWKGRKDYLSFRQKVVKIQAHVRGHQARKKYNVSWAVGVLEKVILRWRRRGVGFRGFRIDSETVHECHDDDILRVFRKKNVEAAIDEAVSRVLSMVESPTARQQYHRILEKYRQAKAELQNGESHTSSDHHWLSSHLNFPNEENSEIY
ncbi:calmodulin-binding transcription activator 4-like [Dorcoceras hygrometricum]|uniref:Calmodulin-binding transcription activator 4-like n=1 Tax=Dorcoceras hygrometricum TaxID=472368 RepID=A0A2Z7D377_9LAMI|nr:calmodulin-binding transcription activator 4-like [Dorcoceras hygrometricum]